MPLDAQLFNTLKDVIAKMFINVRAESAGRETNVVTATQEMTAVNRETGKSDKAYGVGLVLISTNEEYRDILEKELHSWLVNKGFPRSVYLNA